MLLSVFCLLMGRDYGNRVSHTTNRSFVKVLLFKSRLESPRLLFMGVSQGSGLCIKAQEHCPTQGKDHRGDRGHKKRCSP